MRVVMPTKKPTPLPDSLRYLQPFANALAKLPRNGARVRIRNRCLLTGRPRAYYRKFGLSRIALRDLASDGQIPGCVKASW